MKFIVHTDGGARGNPGPAAIGAVIEISNRENKKFIEISKKIGEATNNVAEYEAVVEALTEIKNQKSRRRQSGYGASATKIKNEDKEGVQIQFFLDSILVVNQLNGRFKVKDPKLRELLLKVRLLEQGVGGVVSYTAVAREQNQRADLLVNKALLMSPSLISFQH